jgi:disulfide bond formation protein DsbB
VTPPSRRNLILLAMLGSAGLILVALAFQYLGGLAPCALCHWQRWPHFAAIPIGAAALVLPGVLLPIAGALAAATSGGIGVYHTGVERGWWPGPDTCSAGPVGGMSADQLLDQIMAAPLVRCDEVAWQMLGLSMASWNAVASFGLALLWLWAVRLSRGGADAA